MAADKMTRSSLEKAPRPSSRIPALSTPQSAPDEVTAESTPKTRRTRSKSSAAKTAAPKDETAPKARTRRSTAPSRASEAPQAGEAEMSELKPVVGRVGPGRPRRPGMVQFATRIPSELFDEIDRFAFESGLSKVALTEAAIAEFLRRKGHTFRHYTPQKGK